jgi:uncharacterized protein (DUF3084 family)
VRREESDLNEISREQKAESRKQKAESTKQKAESREQRAQRREQRAESREQRAESREQLAESREQRAGRGGSKCDLLEMRAPYTVPHQHTAEEGDEGPTVVQEGLSV